VAVVDTERGHAVDLETWPGIERRRPSPGSHAYPVRKPLARWLQGEAARAGADFENIRILDVGCGSKPYLPFFAQQTAEYIGLDLANPLADVRGTAERIPFPDGSFQLVLCLQLLEHVEDPPAVVRELARVTTPGGRVLLSTHGVAVYHPDPVDHWRWTATGLEKLVLENGAWRSVTVTPGGGTAACLAMLVSFYLGVLGRRAHLGSVATGLTRLCNLAAERLDGIPAATARERPGSLVANYHVVAEAA
jgi:SAM-dependent methyltransferase